MFNSKNILILKVVFLGLCYFSLTSCAPRMAFGGCAYRTKTGECYQASVQDADIIITSYSAADNLLRNAPVKARLLVTSIADINNLEESTSLGRLIGEQLSARFTQHGYTVIETKLHRGLITIPRTGEFVLSREIYDRGNAQRADMVVTGTYAVGKNQVYITLKMLNGKNGDVLSSYAYNLPIGSNTSVLLQKNFWW